VGQVPGAAGLLEEAAQAALETLEGGVAATGEDQGGQQGQVPWASRSLGEHGRDRTASARGIFLAPGVAGASPSRVL
jgi:hypothetical protein